MVYHRSIAAHGPGMPDPGKGARACRRVVAVVQTVLLMASAAGAITVSAVTFSGNSTFSRSELLPLMELQPPFIFSRSEFTARKLRADVDAIESYYRNFGFLDVAVAAAVDTVRKRVRITVTVAEGPRTLIDSVEVTDNGVLTVESAARAGIRPGAPLVYPRVDSVTAFFADSLHAAGFLTGSADSRIELDTARRRAAVRFDIRPGPRVIVERADIVGLRELKTGIVRSRLTFEPGDTLSSRVVAASQRRLYSTRLFHFVDIAPDLPDTVSHPVPPDTLVPVTVRLDEADYFMFDAGVGYGSYQRLYGSLLVSYGNLFHRGHTIAMSDSVSIVNQWAELIYSTPWILSLPIAVNTSVYYQRHDTWLFDVPLGFSGEFYGFTAGMGQPFGRGWTYRALLEWENVMRLELAPGTELPEDVTARNTASIIGSLSIDRRNDVFNPTSGYFGRTRVQVAGLAGSQSNQFVRAQFDISAYWRGPGSMLAGSNASLGWAGAYGRSLVVPPQDQFYGGGPQSVRGFEYEELVTNDAGNPLGGNVLLVVHPLDIQYRLFWWVNVAAFLDAGYVWPDIGSVYLGDLRFTAGPGLRLASPLGLFRLELGLQLDRLGLPDSYRLHFAYGRPF